MKRSVLVAGLVLGVLAAPPASAQGGGMGGGYGGFGDRPDYGGPMRPRRDSYVPAPSDTRVRREVRVDRQLSARKSRAKRGVVR